MIFYISKDGSAVNLLQYDHVVVTAQTADLFFADAPIKGGNFDSDVRPRKISFKGEDVEALVKMLEKFPFGHKVKDGLWVNALAIQSLTPSSNGATLRTKAASLDLTAAEAASLLQEMQQSNTGLAELKAAFATLSGTLSNDNSNPQISAAAIEAAQRGGR